MNHNSEKTTIVQTKRSFQRAKLSNTNNVVAEAQVHTNTTHSQASLMQSCQLPYDTACK